MNRLEYLQAVKKLLPHAPVCVEIGVYRGDFSKMILDELEPDSLLLVDSWWGGSWMEDWSEDYPDGSKVHYSSKDDYEYVKSIFDNRNDFDTVMIANLTSEDAANHFKEYLFDFIYIDADHRYESVKKDLEMWWELLSENGVIGGHDYNSTVFTGVKIAVDEFCEAKGLKIVLLSGERDFALMRPGLTINQLKSVLNK